MENEFIEVRISHIITMVRTVSIEGLIHDKLCDKIGKGKCLPDNYLNYLIRTEDFMTGDLCFKFPIDKLIDDKLGLEKEELFGFR